MSDLRERFAGSAVRSGMTTLATLCPLLLVVPARAASQVADTTLLERRLSIGVRANF